MNDQLIIVKALYKIIKNKQLERFICKILSHNDDATLKGLVMAPLIEIEIL